MLMASTIIHIFVEAIFTLSIKRFGKETNKIGKEHNVNFISGIFVW